MTNLMGVSLPDADETTSTPAQSNYQNVWPHTDFNTKKPTGLWRTAINRYDQETDSYKWFTIGRFQCEQLAAYAFNIHALEYLEPEVAVGILNKDLEPDASELAMWRARSPLNVQRERSAHKKLAAYLEANVADAESIAG